MAKGKKNSVSLEAIGKAIESKRKKELIEIAEVQESSDLSYNTISKLEKGGDIFLSSFLKICFALDTHPKDLLDIDFDINLAGSPAKPSEKTKITARIKMLIEDNYFQDWRTTGEVKEVLNENYPVKVESNNVSSILDRFHEKGKLKKRKKENSNRNEFRKA